MRERELAHPPNQNRSNDHWYSRSGAEGLARGDIGCAGVDVASTCATILSASAGTMAH